MGLASLYTLIASIILIGLLGKQVMPSVVQNVKTTKVNTQIIETEKAIYEAICRYIIIEQSNPATITDLVNKNYLLAGINNNGFGGVYTFAINATKGIVTISTDISDATVRTMLINSYKNTFKPEQGTGNTVNTTFIFPTTVMHGSGIVSKSIPIQSTAPALTNKYWYDTSGTNAILKISDGTSWKVLSSAPTNSIGSTIATSSGTLPTTGVTTGEVKYVYDSATNGIQQYTYYNGAWVPSSAIGTPNANNYIKIIAGVRQWSDGTYANSCLKYRQSGIEGYNYKGETGDGIYKIDVDGIGGLAPIDVYCDQTTDGGGWTVSLNSTYSSTLGYFPLYNNVINYKTKKSIYAAVGITFNNNSAYFNNSISSYMNTDTEFTNATAVSFFVKVNNISSPLFVPFSGSTTNPGSGQIWVLPTFLGIHSATTSDDMWGIENNFNELTHVVIIFNSSKSLIRYYINGVLKTSIQRPGTTYQTPSTLNVSNILNTIGKRSQLNQYMNGNLKEFRIYNRDLTNEEIINIYNLDKINLI